jgi:electron transfer flavoprotein alpha subunit
MRLHLELDDGWEVVEVRLPAVLTVAERLCAPCKVGPEERNVVPLGRIKVLTSDPLGPGPWGEEASPTKVGSLRLLQQERAGIRFAGDLPTQVARAVAVLHERGALDGRTPGTTNDPFSWQSGLSRQPARATHASGSSSPTAAAGAADRRRIVAVILDRDHDGISEELLSAARALADDVGGIVVAWRQGKAGAEPAGVEPVGAEPVGAEQTVELIARSGPALGPEDVAHALSAWARREEPWAILAPSTAWGREVAARTAASLRCGLVGDAIGLSLVDGELVAAKPACSGALVADVTWTSPVCLVTVRPGVLPRLSLRGSPAQRTQVVTEGRGRVRTIDRGQDDDLEALARAHVVIGVGAAVLPHEYELLGPLTEVLGAELAATRKVTDNGWLPRARQIGITGRSIAPRLYVALALRGGFNHMAGVRAARVILAVNADPDAPVFTHADVGIVGDWHEVVPLLEAELRPVHARGTTRSPSTIAPGVLG